MSRSEAADPPLRHIDAVLTAAHGRRPRQIRDALNRAVDARGLGRCMDEVLLPTTRQIGRWPEHPDDTESAVGLSVDTMRAWLDALLSAAPGPADRSPVLMACAPGDRHSLGLEALTVLLRYQRQPCRMLGPRVSALGIVTAVRVNRPGAVIIAAQLDSRVGQTSRLLHAIDETAAPIFYAGGAYDSLLARGEIPGRYLGRNLVEACEIVLQAGNPAGE